MFSHSSSVTFPLFLPSPPPPHHLSSLLTWQNCFSFITVAALQCSLANFPVVCEVIKVSRYILFFRVCTIRFESPNFSEKFLLSVLCPYFPPPPPTPKKEKRHVKSETQPVETYSESCSMHVSYANIAILERNISLCIPLSEK